MVNAQRAIRAAVAIALLGLSLPAAAAETPAVPTAPATTAATTTPAATATRQQAVRAAAPEPMMKLGPGDAVTVHVFGRPELTTTAYVADDGSIAVPLAGAVQIGGLSPAGAGERIAQALREGQYVLNPQVSVILTEHRSQLVSVLGEVRTPGRFPIQARTTVLDLLAQAGGITENGASTILLLRPGADGQVRRAQVDVAGLRDGRQSLRSFAIRGGDSIVVPEADRYYVYGEVHAPNAYRLTPGMTVVQALATSGGVTTRGSERRIEIRRRAGDGSYVTISPELTDPVQKDDVIRVKERIF